VVSAIDEPAMNWGVRCCATKSGSHAARPNPALDAGADHRDARSGADRDRSEARSRTDNIATGQKAGSDRKIRGDKQAGHNAQGQAEAVLAIAAATSEAIRKVANSIRRPGHEAVNLRVAERYVDAFSGLARPNNTLIVPANLADVGSLIATAMTIVRAQPGHEINFWSGLAPQIEREKLPRAAAPSGCVA